MDICFKNIEYRAQAIFDCFRDFVAAQHCQLRIQQNGHINIDICTIAACGDGRHLLDIRNVEDSLSVFSQMICFETVGKGEGTFAEAAKPRLLMRFASRLLNM